METLDKHFRALTKAAFAKHGFASADLLNHWQDIVGPENAELCVPERISWPRPKEGESPAGTLTVKSAAGRALDVAYKAEHLLERINAYLGYRAIAKIKVQAASTTPPAARPVLAPQMAPSASLDAIADPALKNALSRLNAGIITGKTRSPQEQ